MSDTYFTLLIEFESEVAKDKSIEFLYDEGPVLKEDVEPEYQHLYFFADDFGEPDNCTEVEDKKILIEYDLGFEGYFEAEELLELCAKNKGLVSVYGKFEDDLYEEYFAVRNGIVRKIHKIDFENYDKDKELNDSIRGVGSDEILSNFAELYENGKI